MMEMLKWGAAAMLLTWFCDRTSLGRWRCWQGQELFTRCSSCHAVTEQNKVGPHPSGIFGRPAGTVAAARYSKAMQS
jgi:cytochrome c